MSNLVTREDMKLAYDQISRNYLKLSELVRVLLETLLEENGIVFSGVESRVKEFESFYNKSQNPKYKKPFQDIQDICGLRVIVYYLSDLEKLTEIIKKEFVITEFIDKQSKLSDKEFGYRSYHFIGSVKDEWLHDPTRKMLKGLNFEIQTRTILMHSWAALEHKLAYKPKSTLAAPQATTAVASDSEKKPNRFKRDLFTLSALIELADKEFDRLKRELTCSPKLDTGKTSSS